MFWILAAGLTAIVAFTILAPIWRGRSDAAAQPAAAYDLQVYRDQLSEVDRDLDRGVIQPEDAQRLRAEIGRKVLDADKRLSQAGPAKSSGGILWAAVIVAVAMAGTVALYLREGVVGARDMPMGERIAAADTAYHNRPDQTQAAALAPALPAPDLSQVDTEFLGMIDQLRDAVAQNPDDPTGLDLLASNEMRLGNLSAALAAQDHLVQALGDQADDVQLMQLATLMINAAGGIITPQAEAVLVRALKLNPDQPQARYLQGVLLIQNGRPDRAFPIWQQLLEQGPDDAPWQPTIRNAIGELAWLAGHADYVPPAPAVLPGPDADAVTAAGDLTESERQDMVANMVDGLQQRLATEGGTPQEWARLIGSLAVLDRSDQAAEILSEARSRFADSPQALDTIEEAARTAGMTE
ncbi:c-type cytochrome biogenesis protein CcmI [Paracoccus sp. JM45]|uniref:c-type cytochrome biogenesis protein CcmI n=1 Tax=Paracoccus sp. JM45 TaxID=2283626 RepID=UPI000E6BB62C|nr:c-type cytochrome biogenesis protein CcmI [Paracoccus sp. JM45]RJE80523.1 c-type cytochrome biogenesis protein CcmI [Paracoccus sp. JM45]